MTSIVGIRCKKGVVIGADSSATFGDGQFLRTIEQNTDSKIGIIGERLIIAGTGYVGHAQRFHAVAQKLWDEKKLQDVSDLDGGKALAQGAVQDLVTTIGTHNMKSIEFSALAAFPAKHGEPCLVEFLGKIGFQPEVKKPTDLWFTSSGGGQPITDPFLAFLRQVFWHDGPPNLEGGIFTAYWALKHACELNPGGIKEPIKIAVLARENSGRAVARMLEQEELDEHANLVTDATMHFRKFRDIMEGKAGTSAPPKAPSAPAQEKVAAPAPERKAEA